MGDQRGLAAKKLPDTSPPKSDEGGFGSDFQEVKLEIGVEKPTLIASASASDLSKAHSSTTPTQPISSSDASLTKIPRGDVLAFSQVFIDLSQAHGKARLDHSDDENAEKLDKKSDAVVLSEPMSPRDRPVAPGFEDGESDADAERENKLGSAFEAASKPEPVETVDLQVGSVKGVELSRARYIRFVVEEMNLSFHFAEANFDGELAWRIAADLNQHVIEKLSAETFATRPKGENAVTYFERVWSDLIGQGRVFLDEIEDLDRGLLVGIENRANYLARVKGGTATDHYPSGYPPSRRPGTPVDPVVQKRRATDRTRKDRYMLRLRNR